MKCWSCGKDQSDLSEKKLAFRAECEKCAVWLHCCYNCVFYQPGLPNECRVPETDYIRDRSSMNFCEEFKLLGLGPKNTKESAKSKFDSLFKD